MSLTMVDGVEAYRGRSKRQNSLLRKQLADVVTSVQWSYAVFWSSSSTQSGVLEWGEGCYNGEIKKRKKRYEAHYKYGLQRSKQLRKLYLCMLEGESSTTTHDVNHDDVNHDDDDNCNSTSMMLTPDDLSDEEWYYLVSMSYVFSPSQCLPGKALARGETIWLCNAQYAENKLFSRSLLAKSASIQTVVCFPYVGGVIELGVTELISEDDTLIQHIKSCFSKPDCFDDEDLHYKTTVSTLLKARSNHNNILLASSNSGSSFLRWKQPNSADLLQLPSQNLLRKILHDVPLMHTKSFGLNQDDPNWDRIRENQKFSVIRTMVPTVKEVDKESILNNTIKYLQELEARVEELESCMGSVNFVERTKNLNDSMLIEETSGNYDGNSEETEKVSVLRVKLKETQVMIEVRCCYRDYIVAEIMETLSNLNMDAFSVRSHTLNGFLTLNLKAKFRGIAVASVGMIKRELRRVTGHW